MREIKFRCLDKNSNTIVDWEYLLEYSKMDGFLNEGFIFMQYIGLKDKNGKEIYEGDIVKVFGYDFDFLEVKWDEEWRGFNLIFDARPIEVFPYESSEIEIIGNIYENPNLLKNE